MQKPADILEKIIQRKQVEISDRIKKCTLAQLKEKIKTIENPRQFSAALREKIKNHQTAVIAEIKKASPSRGVIRDKFDPIAIARSYEKHGATCLSVLTDRDFFQGDDDDLKQARGACLLPVLRKDFIINPYQVYETRAMGADAMLLIVAALTDHQLDELYHLGQSLQLDVLIEVHNKDELMRALVLKPDLIGINNRNLKTFETALTTTTHLIKDIPKEVMIISESGLHQREDILHLNSQGVYGFLIGESFMRVPDPGVALAEMIKE